MLLKAGEIVIDKDDPFSNDALGRMPIAEFLSEFVVSSSESMVVCVNAPWGEGKTTFLNMWVQHLSNKKVPVLHYNAWENDYSDDALVNLLGEISAAMSALVSNGDKSKAKEYFEKSKKIGIKLLKRSIPVAAKVATVGALDLDDIVEDTIGGMSEAIAKDKLEQYEESKNTILSFKEALEGLADSLTMEGNKYPLVIVIDELDRCRPIYSIELLEKAKHLFNARNIVFVMAVDKIQLGSSFRAVYGDGLDVDGYIKRFIDFEYNLPSPEKSKYVKYLFDRFGFDEYFSKKIASGVRNEKENALALFADLFSLYKLTLREQNQCCSLLSLSIKSTSTDDKLYPVFLCFLIVLKVKDNESYKKLLETEDKLAFIDEYKKRAPFGQILQAGYGVSLEAHIAACGSIENSRKAFEFYRSLDETDDTNRIIRIMENIEWYGSGSLKSTFGKIDFIQNFE